MASECRVVAPVGKVDCCLKSCQKQSLFMLCVRNGLRGEGKNLEKGWLSGSCSYSFVFFGWKECQITHLLSC